MASRFPEVIGIRKSSEGACVYEANRETGEARGSVISYSNGNDIGESYLHYTTGMPNDDTMVRELSRGFRRDDL